MKKNLALTLLFLLVPFLLFSQKRFNGLDMNMGNLTGYPMRKPFDKS